MSAHTPFAVFSGTNSRYLAEKICNSLGCSMGQMNIEHFSDGEFSVSYEESIRGKDVFLVQSTFRHIRSLPSFRISDGRVKTGKINRASPLGRK